MSKDGSHPSLNVSSLDPKYGELIRDSKLKIKARKGSMPPRFQAQRSDPIMNIAKYEMNKIQKGIKRAQKEISQRQSRNVETIETTTRNLTKSSRSKETSLEQRAQGMLSKSPSSPSITKSIKLSQFKANIGRGQKMAPTPVYLGGMGQQ